MNTHSRLSVAHAAVICGLVLCLVTQPALASSPSGTTDAIGNFQKIFEGAINNSLVIRMELTHNGGVLLGSYFYFRTRASTGFEDSLFLNGKLDSSGDLTMNESDRSGTNTGSFKAKLETSGAGTKAWTIKGTWSNGKRTLPLNLLERAFDLGAGVSIAAKTLSKRSDDPPYQIDARWPQLNGPLNKGARQFNREVSTSIQKQVDAYAKADHNQVEADMLTDTLWLNYEVRYADSHLISVDFPQSVYFSGAAHPLSGHRTLNYDLDSGRAITLAELFTPGSGYLKVIADNATRALEGSQLGAFFPEGATPDLNNYGSWLIEPSGLVIVFDPYQVAPYSEGSPTVFIPFTALRQIIRRSGPAGRFIK
jgi:hypothetical protein